MHQFLDQASHNQEFHDTIAGNFTDRFHDWRITVLFYVAVHYLRALAAKKGINIGKTHHEIELNVNPDRDSARMKITRTAWRNYHQLYHYSRLARYEGLTDSETFEKLMQADHAYCLIHLSDFKKYIKAQGVPCED
jgi:hypothetical protein